MTKETKVGILTVASVVILYLGFSFLKGKSILSTDKTYYVVYEKNEGLKISSPVLLSGIVVGKVSSIDMMPEDYSIRVTFSVAKDVKITTNTEANMSSSILGINVGSIELKILPGEELKTKSVIKGHMDIGISDSIAKNIPTLRNAEELLAISNRILLDIAKNTDRISAIFVNLETITKKLINIIAKNEGAVEKIGAELAKAIEILTDEKHGVKPMLKNINSVSENITAVLAGDTVKHLKKIIANVDTMSHMLANEKNSINKLLLSSELYDNVNKSVADTDRLLLDLRKNPFRYVNFSIFGGARARSNKD